MTVNVSTCSVECTRQWRCLLEMVYGFNAKTYDPYHVGQVQPEILEAALWIMEVWNSELTDPIGFRNAYDLSGRFRFLLIFNYKPEKDFPDEGQFWITYSYLGDLKKKIAGLINNPPLPREEYEKLAGKYSQLISKPINYHHHH